MLSRSSSLLQAAVAAPSSIHAVTAAFRRTESEVAGAAARASRRGFFTLPTLDYPTQQGISPVWSPSQLQFIRSVFHQQAVDTVNELTVGTSFEGHMLDAVLRNTSFDAMHAAAHSAAAEHFNHSFTLFAMRPFGNPIPPSINDRITTHFKSTSAFNDEVLHKALNHQTRSGWLYLLHTPNGFALRIYPHGTCPVASAVTPLLAINLHEHAHAIDYSGPDAVERYVRNCMRAWNWNVAQRTLDLAVGTQFLELLNF